MPSQFIAGASVKDVEAALIHEYGNSNVSEKVRSETSSMWTFRISTKAVGKCKATVAPGGVTLDMSGHTPMVLIVVAAVGYMFLIIPGLIITVFVVVARLLTEAIVSSRFPKFVAAVRQRVQPPPLPV